VSNPYFLYLIIKASYIKKHHKTHRTSI